LSKRLKQNLLLLGCATLLFLLAAEAAVRYSGIGPDMFPVYADLYSLSPNPRLRYELLPGAVDGKNKINSHGMRDREFKLQKSPDTFRIACVGDSIMYGYDVKQSQAMPRCLEEVLNSSSGGRLHYEAMNFGVTGYSFTQVLETIRTKALKFDPDLIIYGYCLNDPQEYSLEEANLTWKLKNAGGFVQKKKTGVNKLLYHSRIFRLAFFTLKSLTRAGGIKDTTPDFKARDPYVLARNSGKHVEYLTQLHELKETWSPVARGMKKLAELSRKKNIPVVIVIFPFLQDLDDDYPLENLHRTLTREFAGYGLYSFDLMHVFREFQKIQDIPLKIDRLHPSPYGHGLAAAATSFFMYRKKLVPGGDRAMKYYSTIMKKVMSEQYDL